MPILNKQKDYKPMKKFSKNKLQLLKRASLLPVTCRLIHNMRGGFRKHHPLGSTYSPQRVIIINNKSFSFAGARQFLCAMETKI
jgi:hypothetical protein